MKKKELWLFLLKLLPLTVILGYLWFSWLQARYPGLIEPIAVPFFKLTGVRKWWLVLMMEHFTSIVPFVALVLSTPGIIKDWKRSIGIFLGGMAIIVAMHLLMSTAIYHIMAHFAKTRTSYVLIVPVYLINDALPLALWLLFFPRTLGRLFGFFSRNTPGAKLRAGSA